MVRTLASTAPYLLANAAGLLLAMALLPGFKTDVMSFTLTVIIFTAIEVVASTLLTKIAIKNIPAMTGGVALVTTFVGLGALIAGVILPMILFKKIIQSNRT